MKKALPIIILILLIAVSIVAWQVTKKEALPTVSCTQEAMLCPDGSYVGRTGPKCEFASCPVKSSANLSQTGLGQSSGSDKNTGANSAKNVTTDEASPVPQRSPTLLSPLNPPATTVQPTALPSNTDEPPLKLKGIGVNFEDFKFTKEKLQFDRLFMGFGFVIPGSSSSSGQNKSNPQPTYVVPLGTPVRSLVDGIVAAIPTLWSGDYSIQVTADGKMQKWVYETEHIINPKVAVGDKVTAGQVIGEVINFDKGAAAGYGAVEIGI